MTKGVEEKQQLNNDVKVVICGGGPGGLLTSILLHKIGIPSTVLEATTEPDQWNSKSYTLVLSDKGKGSLEKGGCLESAMEAGNERKFVYFFDGQTGETKAIPKKIPGIGFTRPLLVQVLEKISLENHPGVTLKRGTGVSHVTKGDTNEGLLGGGGSLQVHLEDGTVIPATHVIGADGKWSKVRQSFPSLNSQGTMITCPSYGVHMNCPIVPDGWKTDGTYVIRPISNDGTFYMIISPRPKEAGLSIGMVCFDEILEKYPWLSPPDDMKIGDYGKGGGWNDEYSALPDSMKSDVTLSDHLEALFQKEIPAFYEKIGKETLQTARINRRVTWLQMTGEEGMDVTYTTEDGNVTLIGDASHAMTPSMGEGCNTALESAVKLVDCISSIMEQKGETATATATSTGGCSIETMSEAFMQYGSSRPKEIQPIQEASASRNIMKK